MEPVLVRTVNDPDLLVPGQAARLFAAQVAVSAIRYAATWQRLETTRGVRSLRPPTTASRCQDCNGSDQVQQAIAISSWAKPCDQPRPGTL
jgi:hypothetical protein